MNGQNFLMDQERCGMTRYPNLLELHKHHSYGQYTQNFLCCLQ